MRILRSRFFAGICPLIFGVVAPTAAEPILVPARFVDEAGEPLSGMAVRVLIGSEPNSRAPEADHSLRTDAEGRLVFSVESPIRHHTIRLDSIFSPHPARRIEVGLEVDLLGRRALYWMEIDLVKAGPVAGMTV